jgi:hypothetical protein
MYIKEYHTNKNINPLKRRPNRDRIHTLTEIEIEETNELLKINYEEGLYDQRKT